MFYGLDTYFTEQLSIFTHQPNMDKTVTVYRYNPLLERHLLVKRLFDLIVSLVVLILLEPNSSLASSCRRILRRISPGTNEEFNTTASLGGRLSIAESFCILAARSRETRRAMLRRTAAGSRRAIAYRFNRLYRG